MKNNLTTIKDTSVVLAKGKSLLGITAKILSGSKALATVKTQDLTTQTHKDITIIGDLMWENVPEDNRMNWKSAMEYAKNLRLSGYDDWRLPTIEELSAVVKACGGTNVTLGDDDWRAIIGKNRDNESYQSSYKAKGFASNDYWSSITYAAYSGDAWVVSFGIGLQIESGKPNGYCVRCVRAGQ